MSGITKTPSIVEHVIGGRGWSGPFAPSARMRHFTWSTLRLVIVVLGRGRDQDFALRGSAGRRLRTSPRAGKPCTVPHSFGESPLELFEIDTVLVVQAAYLTSATPITLYPTSDINCAALEPTLPNPCTMTSSAFHDRCPACGRPRRTRPSHRGPWLRGVRAIRRY